MRWYVVSDYTTTASFTRSRGRSLKKDIPNY